VTVPPTPLLGAHENQALGRLRGQLAPLKLPAVNEASYVPASQVGAELLRDHQHGIREDRRRGDDQPGVRASNSGAGANAWRRRRRAA
jgi:hypothetical protein